MGSALAAVTQALPGTFWNSVELLLAGIPVLEMSVPLLISPSGPAMTLHRLARRLVFSKVIPQLSGIRGFNFLAH